jgi:hypothetical protein
MAPLSAVAKCNHERKAMSFRKPSLDSLTNPQEKERHPRPWRKGSLYGEFLRPIDRNDRARIMWLAEGLERRTKLPRKRDGAIGQSGLAVLRALLFHFLNPERGQLDPSYRQIQRTTGFCLQTISLALKRLVASGILFKQRRLDKVQEYIKNAWTGRLEWRIHSRQRSNAYMLNFPFCAREAFGDLAMPLFRPKPELGKDTSSTFQRESTSRGYSYSAPQGGALLSG